jgi:hypothetical protein
MKVTKELTGIKWGPRHTPLSAYTINIPAGVLVKPIPDRKGEYWIDDLSKLGLGSFEMHDAVHYGIKVTEDQVEDFFKPVDGPLRCEKCNANLEQVKRDDNNFTLCSKCTCEHDYETGSDECSFCGHERATPPLTYVELLSFFEDDDTFEIASYMSEFISALQKGTMTANQLANEIRSCNEEIKSIKDGTYGK